MARELLNTDENKIPRSLQPLRLNKIISGGQTGVDKAALIAAKEANFTTGGTAPRDYHTTNGSDYTLLTVYKLKESWSASYAERTGVNIDNSDGTLILARKMRSPGTKLTASLCHRRCKPVYIVDLLLCQRWEEEHLNIINFLKEDHVTILNVAGNSEASCPGIADESYRFLRQLFSHVRRQL